MMRGLGYLVSALVIWCALTVGAAFAQASIDYQNWQQTATQIERSFDQERISVESLEALRESVVFWRDQFARGTQANADQIETLRGQIDALGPPPGEGE